MKKAMNYESSSGVVHDGGIYAKSVGITKCGIEFSIRAGRENPWFATNKNVTCKKCKPVKKLVFALDKKISIFGIDTDEKACLATIRARLLSAMETWDKHVSGEINKAEFDSDLRRDLRDTVTDLHEYVYRYTGKSWCNQRQKYVSVKTLPVNEIKHSIDGKVPSYYSHQCCQSNTCKCCREVVK